tara:strand:- start:168 stop:557 length:390 start_codon:yes stop_codon:yes gene_type:complete
MYKELQPLTKLLDTHFNLNPSRTKCMVDMVSCMIKAQTINMADICQIMNSDCKPSSSYRRLQRFISEELLPQKSVAELVCAIKGLDKEEKWKLTMDRTNWKLGKVDINILYLGVCCNNVAIPLFFFFRG